MWILLLAASCAKGEGGTCYKGADCAEGLACLGEDVRRCEKCAENDACSVDGLCTASEGKCTASSNEDCAKGFICTGKGGCTAKDGVCTVGGDADCKQSEACKNEGFCKAKGNNCVKEKKPAKAE